MEVKLQKWGNSVGLRIPNSLLKSLNLSMNDKVELKEEDDKIVITKSQQKRVSLEELFKNYGGGKLENTFEWDEPIGRELW